MRPAELLTLAKQVGESDFCWFGNPQRDELEIGGIGCAAAVTASGQERMATAAREIADRTVGMLADDLFGDQAAPVASGVNWLGGFAFMAQTPRSNHWEDFDALRFVLPQLAISARGGQTPETRLTINRLVHHGDDVAQHLAAVEAMLDALATVSGVDPSDSVDLDAVGVPPKVAAPAGAKHYEASVARAVERIARGEFSKLVLARELELEVQHDFDVRAISDQLNARFPSCMSFVIGHEGQAFCGSTPELLVRREGRRVSTMALAGSAKRGLDGTADEQFGRNLLASSKDLEEHAIVVRRIERTLGRLSSWVVCGQQPELVKLKNVQHLATPIRAQLTQPRPLLELAALMHPTPAVGGEPWPEAAAAIAELEGFERGWYAGGLGWTDALEDGELYVGLRCALISGNRARLFAGAGIVSGSDPATELAETETKFEAMLHALLAARAS
ncbi:MAG: isochorismate synthase [Thermoleophilaceae bacterium]|nr:isochorismate synthase [Thermoleophilaceae bacterium]